MRRGKAIIVFSIATAALAASAAPGFADDAPVCTAEDLDAQRLLRRLSLDLRGRVPSIEELEQAEAKVSALDDTVEGFLQDPGFGKVAREYHEAMFWPNVSNVRINEVANTLGKATELLFIQSAGRRNRIRGASDATCADVEQTAFDPAFPNEFRPTGVVADGQGIKREGYRLVRPYWAPATTVKVCAYDAQETREVKVGNQTIACASAAGIGREECGCGPGLRYCYSPDNTVRTRILADMREQLSRAVDRVASGARPYTDIVLGDEADLTGPLVHYRKYLSLTSNGTIYAAPEADDVLPAKAYEDASWSTVKRPGVNAGVVTMPAYLLRFQSQRGRANRFRIDFSCEYFVPSSDLTPKAGCSETADDLTQRCNCQYCHAQLEPLAAHFGLFSEAGVARLEDTKAFPRQRAECVGSNSFLCRRFYVTQADAHRPGWLSPYQYADVHPDYAAKIEGGPRALADGLVQDGSFSRCAVRRVVSHLFRREMRIAGQTSDELMLLDALDAGFRESGYSFPWLVRKVATLPQYRRVR